MATKSRISRPLTRAEVDRIHALAELALAQGVDPKRLVEELRREAGLGSKPKQRPRRRCLSWRERRLSGRPSRRLPRRRQPRWRTDWLEFASRVEERLAAGSQEFGDANLDAELVELLDELQQELLDLAGWGCLLWARLEKFRRELEERRREPSR